MTELSRCIQTPIGTMQLVASDQYITEIRLPNCAQRAARRPRAGSTSAGERAADQLLDAAAQQLLEYFAGERARFELPLSGQGTAFQRAVWRQLRKIPYGSAMSYGALASAIGRPNAARAVGAANARNPHPVVVPCHRVIGGDGSLTGFAGGVKLKRWLLDHEQQAGAS